MSSMQTAFLIARIIANSVMVKAEINFKTFRLKNNAKSFLHKNSVPFMVNYMSDDSYIYVVMSDIVLHIACINRQNLLIFKHPIYINAISTQRVVHEHMRNRSDDFVVLYNRTTAHSLHYTTGQGNQTLVGNL